MAENLENQQYVFLREKSTEELERLLQADLQQENTNPKMVEYILEVLLERDDQTEESRAAAVQTAWEDFQQNYNIPEGEGRSLYPMFPEAMPHRQSVFQTKPMRWASIAAVIVFMLLTMATPVMGAESLFTIFGRWTEEVFYFVRYGSLPDETQEEPVEYYSDNEGLMQMWNALVEHGATDVDLPTRIPDRFTFLKLDESVFREGDRLLSALFESSNGNLLLQVRILPEGDSFTYEKDEDLVEEYIHAGHTFYIMQNIDKSVCRWGDADWDCSISGILSREEIIQIIESIF